MNVTVILVGTATVSIVLTGSNRKLLFSNVPKMLMPPKSKAESNVFAETDTLELVKYVTMKTNVQITHISVPPMVDVKILLVTINVSANQALLVMVSAVQMRMNVTINLINVT